MANSILIALSNPIGPDREEEFNHWYNEIHGSEVQSLEGFVNLTRYRAVAQVVPPASVPTYRYLCVYELSNAATAIQSLLAGAADFNMSDAVDLEGATGIAFEQIFTTVTG